MEEIGFPVHAQARLAVFRPDLQRAQGEIGLHAVLRRLDLRLVKIGVLRRPEAGRLQRQRRAAPRKGLLQHALRRPDAHDALLYALRKQADAVSLRFSADRADILLRHALQPDGLPQTGYRRIPHSAAPASLLAVGQNVGLKPVGHADKQDVFLLQGVRNVEGKGLIAAGMRAERRTVQPDLRDLIRRAEVQQHAPPHKARGQEEAAPVVQRPVPGKLLMHAGEQRLRREGDADRAVITLRKARGVAHGKFPHPVEVEIRIPAQRGAGILLPRIAGQRPARLRPKFSEFPHAVPPLFSSGETQGRAPAKAPPPRGRRQGKWFRWGGRTPCRRH